MGDLHHVGEVVFALQIVIAHRAEQRQGLVAGQSHQPAIAEIDQALGGARLLVLANGEERIALGDETAIAAGIGGAETQRCHGRPRGQRRTQRLQRLRAHQRGVRIKNQNVVHRLGQGLAGGEHRMGGAQALGLHEHPCVRNEALRLGRHIGPIGADHHGDLVRTDRPRRLQHMVQHGAAGDLVEHFGQARSHAGALTGGQNHHEQAAFRHHHPQMRAPNPKRAGGTPNNSVAIHWLLARAAASEKTPPAPAIAPGRPRWH